MFFRKIFFVMACCLIVLSACTQKPMAPKAALDTPEHHVTNGKKLFQASKFDASFQEFVRAKELAPKYSPAHVGIGLVYGIRGDFENALSAMEQADRYADGKEQKVAVSVGYMRLYITGMEGLKENWLQQVESNFKHAVNISPDFSEPYYYMGIAYKASYRFRKAASQFNKVLELNKEYVNEADREYEIIQKIERATPGSKVGKKIALVEQITRADIAALFIEELKVDELFAKKTQKQFDTSFKSPEKKFITGEYVVTVAAKDIENHVLKTDIEAVIEIKIKGLQPFPDHTYRPYQTITRAEYAMMMEDILIKITGVDGLATMFIGAVSPFPDLRSDLPFFNAVMICSTRGIMAASNLSTGEFNSMGTISGAEALLGIRALKSQF